MNYLPLITVASWGGCWRVEGHTGGGQGGLQGRLVVEAARPHQLHRPPRPPPQGLEGDEDLGLQRPRGIQRAERHRPAAEPAIQWGGRRRATGAAIGACALVACAMMTAIYPVQMPMFPL